MDEQMNKEIKGKVSIETKQDFDVIRIKNGDENGKLTQGEAITMLVCEHNLKKKNKIGE